VPHRNQVQRLLCASEREHLLHRRIVEDSLKIVRALGYDMNTIEWAVREGVPYAIDFMNPAPDMDVYSLTPVHFEWVVSAMADLAIRLAKAPPTAAPSRSWPWYSLGTSSTTPSLPRASSLGVKRGATTLTRAPASRRETAFLSATTPPPTTRQGRPSSLSTIG